jgi:hypothetical protein
MVSASTAVIVLPFDMLFPGVYIYSLAFCFFAGIMCHIHPCTPRISRDVFRLETVGDSQITHGRGMRRT